MKTYRGLEVKLHALFSALGGSVDWLRIGTGGELL
jgi:hypothetical protein